MDWVGLRSERSGCDRLLKLTCDEKTSRHFNICRERSHREALYRGYPGTVSCCLSPIMLRIQANVLSIRRSGMLPLRNLQAT
jgi:hypothetical protein